MEMYVDSAPPWIAFLQFTPSALTHLTIHKCANNRVVTIS